FEGAANDNYYGRVLRVPQEDLNGQSAGDDFGMVVEIKEQKDILALEPNETYRVNYKGRTYGFTKEELINLREFNTGVYAFKADKIIACINKLSTDNVQGELYLTDLIRIFNENDLTVKASEAVDNRTVLGFNVKSVLKEMESYARESVYEKLKDIITIVDEDDFFIADEVVEQIVELDEKRGPLDISIGTGARIDKDVQLNKRIKIGNHAELSGRVILGEGVRIHENVEVSTYSNQTLKVGSNSEIFKGDIIKGNLEIGKNCRIESSVNMTGSDEFPTRIGNNVTIKGTSYIFGGTVEDEVWIEHSVLKCKHIKRVENADGTVQAIRYFLPKAEGLQAIDDLIK
ncbi:multidrug transporter, partial [candidate division KSB1 bacterium]|nr:multidrug transporter [candidate division KSB1 bacterium]